MSAYRDKIVATTPGSPHDLLRRAITRHHRKVEVAAPGTDPNLPASLIPTFPEFVDHLLVESNAGVEVDIHWAPAYSFCNPCQVNVKLEMLCRQA